MFSYSADGAGVDVDAWVAGWLSWEKQDWRWSNSPWESYTLHSRTDGLNKITVKTDQVLGLVRTKINKHI